MKRTALVSLLALATAHAASAQTSIVPDTAPGIGLGTTVSPAGNIYTIDGGTLSGTNLFHSFNAFSVGAGDTAQWVHSAGDPSSIGNVINRVTGGTPSSIMGVLDSTAIPNADFYFINPAGIVFSGQGAQVNVPAAAHFSTGSELRFANGDVFSVATPSGSTLSVAAPQAFGFLGNEGNIFLSDAGKSWSGDGVDLAPAGGDFHLSASNISLLFAGINGTSISLAAVGPIEATVALDGRADGLQGHIDLDSSQLDYGSVARPGETVIRAGSLTSDLVDIHTRSAVGEFDGPVDIALTGGLEFYNTFIYSGREISIVADSATIANFSAIWGGLLPSGEGDGGGAPIVLQIAGELQIIGDSQIRSAAGSGTDGGDITITADSLIMSDGSITASSVAGTGGTISVSVSNATLTQFSSIKSETGSGTGGHIGLSVFGTLQMEESAVAASAIDLFGDNGRFGNAGNVTVTAGNLLLDSSSMSSVAGEDGNGGLINVSVAGDFVATNSSQISTATYGLGDAGSISIGAGAASLIGSGIASDAYGTGNGGSIDVTVDGGPLALTESSITTASLADGDAGAVSVTTSTLELAASHISSDSQGAGNAGGVTVVAGNATLVESHISSDAEGSGDGGAAIVEVADALVLTGDSSISSDALGEGDAGGVAVAAGNLQITGPARITSDALGNGHGGSVEVQVAGTLAIDSGGRISSDVGGTGNAGDVLVNADSIVLTNGGAITSNSAEGSTGNAGNVRVSASAIQISSEGIISSDAEGEGNAGSVEVDAGALELAEGAIISSSTFGAGDAGGVVISGGTVTLDDSAIISDAAATGNAGGVQVDVAQLTMNNSAIRSEAASSGAGGEIGIEVAGPLALTGSSISTNSNGTGNAGDVLVKAGTVTLAQQSAISSAALSPSGGQSGSVTLAAADLSITGASVISTSSANANAAGEVEVFADKLTMSGAETSISSENTSAAGGAAGSVAITTGGARIADGASVTTNSTNGAAGNITFLMPPDAWLILSGETLPGVIETSSGPGTGGVITISSPLAIISNGGIISALGDSGGANVRIDANYFIASADRLNVVEVDGTLTFTNAIYDVSAGTTDADLSVMDASGVLRGQCSAVRADGRASQLNIPQSGPFGAAIWSDILPQVGDPATSGGCQ